MNWSSRVECIETESKSIPKEIGVYEIQGRIDSEKYTRRYVGMTDDLNRRFLEHLSDKEPNLELKKFLKNKKSFFRYSITKTVNIAKDIEKGLYEIHNHTYNDLNHPPSGSGGCLTVTVIEKNP